MNNNLRTLDCFCGAGGLSIGFEKAGFDVIYAFDIDEASIKTYTHNPKYHHGQAFVRDIYKVTKRSIEEDLGHELGKIDVMIGGPPCQGFSVQRRGDDNDPRNNLILEYCRLIKEITPQFFVLENVGGLMSTRGKPYVKTLLDTLSAAGYAIQMKKVTASDFGVPQDRKRVIIVGELSVNGKGHFEYPTPLVAPKVTVREAIIDLMDKDENDVPNHKADKLSVINLKRIQAIAEGEGQDSLPDELQLYSRRYCVKR